MRDSALDVLDARAGVARRALGDLAERIEVPDRRQAGRQRRPEMLVAAAVLLAVALIAAVVVVGGDDRDSTELATGAPVAYVPTETLGLPMRGVMRDQDQSGTEQAVLYGTDVRFDGPSVAVITQDWPEEWPDPVLEPGDGEELVDINGAPGLLMPTGDQGLIVTWQIEERLMTTALTRGFEAAQALELASQVVVDGTTAVLPDPEAAGLVEVLRGAPGALGGMPGAPGPDGISVSFESEDQQRRFDVRTGPGDRRHLDALRALYPTVSEVHVGDAAGLLAPITIGDGPPDTQPETIGWVLAWQPEAGTVVHLWGIDITDNEALDVARSTRPFTGERLEDLPEHPTDTPG